MRILFSALCSLVFAVQTATAQQLEFRDQSMTRESKTAYSGTDYLRVTIPSDGFGAGADQCLELCFGDDKCRAFSYERSTSPDKPAICAMKSAVPITKKESDCCDSGEKKRIAVCTTLRSSINIARLKPIKEAVAKTELRLKKEADRALKKIAIKKYGNDINMGIYANELPHAVCTVKGMHRNCEAVGEICRFVELAATVKS